MIAMEVIFIGGRYHATPWGRYVNEGAVEWPPSPWRILRALLAMWRRKLPHIDPGAVTRMIGKLSTPPEYFLPPTTSGHTRHYMPKYKSVLDGKTDKVFNSFLRVDREETLIVLWREPILSDEERDILAELTAGLNYLGRSESWVKVRVVETCAVEPNCRPVVDVAPAPGAMGVSLLCLREPKEYAQWREGELDRQKTQLLAAKREKARSAGRDPDKVKLTKTDLATVEKSTPEGIMDCLGIETSDLQQNGWSLPPGTRYIDYAIPETAASITTHYQLPGEKPTTARFALAGDTVQGDVRPLLTNGLYLAETVRQALMSKARDENGFTSPVFSGKDGEGRPLTGHRHAYVLPCDDDNDGRIDHIIVYARAGFGEIECDALADLRRIWQSKANPDLFPVLTTIGQISDFEGRGEKSPCLGRAKRWISRTPYMMTRHPKKNGKDGPRDQINRELEFLGFPVPVVVEPVVGGAGTRRKFFRWSEFARIRKAGGGVAAGSRGLGFTLVFPSPVQGPIALGYGAHYGLGLFIPEE